MNSSYATYAILGMGCVGSLLAHHLHRHNVMAVRRDDTLRSNKNVSSVNCSSRNISGVNSDNINNNVLCRQIYKPDCATPIQTITLNYWNDEPLDWLIITTKAGDTINALNSLPPEVPTVKRILLIQNGLGQQQAVVDWIQQRRDQSTGFASTECWVGSTTEGAYRTSHDSIVYAGQGEYFIGPWQTPKSSNCYESPTIDPLFTCDTNISERLFGKLAINAVINPLTALLRCKNGELVSNPDYRARALHLCEEVTYIFSQLKWKGAEQLADKVMSVATATGANQSSTLNDVLNNRRTELRYINGYIVHHAQQHGLLCPVNYELMERLRDYHDFHI